MGKKEPKRRAWRKTKLEDVEEALEDDRLVNKLKNQGGKDKFSSDTLSDLFTVDTKGSCEGLTQKTKRELARAKIFGNKSPKLGLSAAEQAKVSDLQFRLTLGRKQKKVKKPEIFDVWAAPDPTARPDEETEASTVRKVAMQRPRKVPKTLHQKVSAAPAVLPAHEGQSVNPTVTAYEDLACLAVAQHLQQEREVEEVDRQLHPLTSGLIDSLGAEEVKKLAEEEKVLMYRTLVCKDKGAAAEGEEGEEGPGSRPVKMKPKSQSKRNKDRRKRHLDNLEAQKKAQKKLERSVGEIGAILKEMKQEEEFRQKKREYKKEIRARKQELEQQGFPLLRGHRLGKQAFEEEAILVPKADDGKKGLRGLSLKANTALRDRASSILRRGLLPAPRFVLEQQARVRHKTRRKQRKLKDRIK